MSFRQREGACLLKTPDLVLQDFHAPRSFTIIDIKIVDPSAASYDQATAISALHRHRALEAAGPRDYFGPSRRPPPCARMRVVTFVISTFGSLGAQAQALIKDIGRRTTSWPPRNTRFFASICHAITDPPVTKIRLWASFGV